jgi:hypothetical protein
MTTSNNIINDISNILSSNTQTELLQTPEFQKLLADTLSESSVTLTFKKKDGTLRTMHCTKNLNSIPSEKHPKGSNKSVSGSALTVFDLQLGEWRSFLVSNLVSLEGKTA